ncbi:SRPBCC domain-containing protein [Deinococcus hopiensis]|nr:SRPBCC domain-containing protein [Deinococcus hopiensis]
MSRAARAEITVQAPLERVFELLVDFGAYGRWNPFVVDVTGASRAAEGVQMRFRLLWREGRYIHSDERVTRVQPPADGAALVAWRYESALARWGLLRSERVQTLRRLPNGHTAYTTEEVFHGPAAAFVPVHWVQAGFEAQARAMKDDLSSS